MLAKFNEEHAPDRPSRLLGKEVPADWSVSEKLHVGPPGHCWVEGFISEVPHNAASQSLRWE